MTPMTPGASDSVRIRPASAAGWLELGNAQLEGGEVAAAIESFEQAIAVEPAFLAAHSRRLMALHFQTSYVPGAVLAAHVRFGEMLAGVGRVESSAGKNRDPDRRLRVGYVAPDFRDAFIEPLLAHHDSRKFEVVRYAGTDGEAVPDARDSVDGAKAGTESRGPADSGAVSLRGLTDDAAARQIADDRIDVLVDLAGHLPGNRLGVFARRPAPVQFAYLGYPDTTGLKAIDYRITDTIADPPATTSPLYVEHVLRLPRCAWCFAPPADAPDVNALPAAQNASVTFGCHAELAAMNGSVMDAWAAILKAVGNSRLRVINATFATAGARARVQKEFLRRGVADRVELIRAGTTRVDRLAAYHRIDVALDTFPWNGAAATCEALWLGVPVVTLAGNVHACRIGASLLDAAGLSDWVTRSPEEYVSRAAAAASDAGTLAALRATSRERVRKSPLTNGRTFAAAVESVYRAAWQRYCAGA